MELIEEITTPIKGENTEETLLDQMITSDSEVIPKKSVRKFSPAFKKRVLKAADACQNKLEIGALVRKEGIYSGYLTKWRKQLAEGKLDTKSVQRQKNDKTSHASTNEELVALLKEKEFLKLKLEKAEAIIATQKKISEIVGLSMELVEMTALKS